MSTKNITVKDIFDQLFAADIGGDVNFDASVINNSTVEVHFWDGRRYLLSWQKLPDGCSYDAATGLPLENK